MNQTTRRLSWLLLPLLLFLLLLPMWQWWGSRGMSLGSWACLAVLLHAGLAKVKGITDSAFAPKLSLLLPTIAAYLTTLCFGFPPLVSALLGTASLSLLLAPLLTSRPFSAPLLGLLWLALPISASLDFFLGFPMRLLAGHLAVWTLSPWGVELQGTALLLGEQCVSVDAPCSGVKMLWQGVFFVTVLGLLQNLETLRYFLLTGGALLAVLLANSTRATALVLVESGTLPAPAWGHEAIGLLCFALCLGALFRLAAWLPRRPIPTASAPKLHPAIPLFSVAGIVGLTLLFLPARGGDRSPAEFPGWPSEFDGEALVPQESQPLDARFAKEFPGEMQRFRMGNAEVLLRWVGTPTRLLHHASECLQAEGATIRNRKLVRDQRGRIWSQFEAIFPRGVGLEVRELIYTSGETSWSDASAWFWSAFSGSSSGPWWSITISRQL